MEVMEGNMRKEQQHQQQHRQYRRKLTPPCHGAVAGPMPSGTGRGLAGPMPSALPSGLESQLLGQGPLKFQSPAGPAGVVDKHSSPMVPVAMSLPSPPLPTSTHEASISPALATPVPVETSAAASPAFGGGEERTGAEKEPRWIEWAELSNVEFLRHGTHTTIFLADLNDEKVAVKTCREGLSASEIDHATRELQHEGRILANLSHPNIIMLHGQGIVPLPTGALVYFLVLEHMGGGTLSTHLYSQSKGRGRGEPLPLPRALEVGRGIACAMAYLHDEAFTQYLILHRDLKPDNIGFAADGTVKVLDFGLSRSLPRYSASGARDASHSLTGVTGSLRYMAPETALGRPYDERADVYSFAVVLWEAIHGNKPYAGMSLVQHRAAVCEHHARPELASNLPKLVLDVIGAAWSPVVEQRPPFAQVALMLDTAIRELPSHQGSHNRSSGQPRSLIEKFRTGLFFSSATRR